MSNAFEPMRIFVTLKSAVTKRAGDVVWWDDTTVWTRLKIRLAAWLHRFADRILPTAAPTPVGGKLLAFVPRGRNLGRPVLNVVSVRGGFEMGRIEWSNQWNRPRFSAHKEAVFDQQCVAEIYAAMREMK